MRPDFRTQTLARLQVCEPLFQPHTLPIPPHPIHTRRRFPAQLSVCPPQRINGDVVWQGGEPFRLPLPRCAPALALALTAFFIAEGVFPIATRSAIADVKGSLWRWLVAVSASLTWCWA
ncbi:MAG TPA: hypothetical protein VMD98_08445 [Bryocella sp.]|nr:hypothetical protein [Bryocella sp.]